MFSGTKFRFWSRQSSSKKDAEKEASKNKSKNLSLSTGEDEGCRQPNTRQDKLQLERLQEDCARLEDTVEELTPYQTKAFALEKKLIYITKSFERKQNRYSTTITSLEVENEQLREEIGRMKSICGSCYFCSRHQMTTRPEQAAKHFPSSRRADQGSNESLQSSESWRRLQKLEEEQSAIIQETSRQKQETSRCLEQISSEVVNALVSQKVLRRDCTQLQCRILQLEKQNSQLNEAIFRRHPPYHSQTKFLADQRNEKVMAYHPELPIHAPWNEHSLTSNRTMEAVQYEEKKTSQKLFRRSPNHRFSVEICRPTSDYLSYSYIPEQVMANSTSAKNIITTNHDCQTDPFHKDVSQVDNVTKNARHSLGDFFLDIRNKVKTAQNWDLSTSSTLTLRDETINGENDSQCKNSFSRGSTFSLNDVLDGNIDELQLSIQSHEGTKSDDSASSTSNINRLQSGMEPAYHHKDCQQLNSEPLTFVGDKKDTGTLEVANDCHEKTLKVQSEPPQIPFASASNEITFDNSGVAKQKTAAEKRHRYSYPAVSPVKSALTSEVHKMHCTQTENSTSVRMAEAREASPTVIEPKETVQKFELGNFETVFDNSDTETNGTIKERNVPVAGIQPQYEHEASQSRSSAENADAESAVNKSTMISTAVQEDFWQIDVSAENSEKWNLMQESVLEQDTSNQSHPASKNLTQKNVSQRNLLKETPSEMDTYTSGQNSSIASPPHCKALRTNDVPVTPNERRPSENNLSGSSHTMHTIKQQDTASKQESRPNYCDYHPEQPIQSEKRKHNQNDIPAESVDIKAEMESIIQKKRERVDSISNENVSKVLAKDVIMSKDKVMALTAYFEEVHVEQCPDCQQNNTRCRISSAYRNSLGSKENSLSEDDSKPVDGSTVTDLDQNPIKQFQDGADEPIKTVENPDLGLLSNDTLTSLISEKSNREAADSDKLERDISIQVTPHGTSGDENVLASHAGLKGSMNSRGNTNEANNSQIECTLSRDEMKAVNKTEQLKHNLISLEGESKNSVCKKTENSKDQKYRLDGKNLTTTSTEQLISKHIQWKSLPSVSVSSSDSHLPVQVKYIRTLSLKSFSDALTPPPSPNFHKDNEESKCFDQAYGLTRECSKDTLNMYSITREMQYDTQNLQSDKLQGNSQTAKTLSEKQTQDPTEEESRGCLQSYAQLQCQGHSQVKQFTVISEDKSEAQYFPQWRHLHSQIHSAKQGQPEVYSRHESAQNDPSDHLIDDLQYPQCFHSPKTNSIPSDEEFKTHLYPVQGCQMFSPIEIQPDDRQDDLTCNAYPDLVSSSHPKVTMRRSQNSQKMEGKCNILTEEDIMKYRLDCRDSRRKTIGDLQTNIVSIEAMGSPEDSHGLRTVSTKPPLPPRRFHVTNYYVRDSSNPLLDPREFFNFENEVLGLIPVTPHADASPTKNEFLTEANPRTAIWDRERTYPSHSTEVDFNFRGADAMKQGGETNSLGLENATVHHSQSIDNRKTGTFVSPPQGNQPVVGCQSSGKRSSYPDCSGKDHFQPHTWLDNKDMAATMTGHHPFPKDQTTRPVSFHQVGDQTTKPVSFYQAGDQTRRPVSFHQVGDQTTKPVSFHQAGDQTTRPVSFYQVSKSATYGDSFNSSLNAASAHRKRLPHCQQLESESNPKNSKDTENDLVFNEISKQIENLRQTVSELQKRSTEN